MNSTTSSIISIKTMPIAFTSSKITNTKRVESFIIMAVSKNESKSKNKREQETGSSVNKIQIESIIVIIIIIIIIISPAQ